MGIENGLKILDEVRRQTGLPVLTDVHDIEHIAEVASVVDAAKHPRSYAVKLTLFERLRKVANP